ncbi:hypothetical protein [Nonomuraea rubra]|uniref:hypothetical protein n=1 Tax=Nonomuraea rubra TaxID=46180 RepID=UPI003CD06F6F
MKVQVLTRATSGIAHSGELKERVVSSPVRPMRWLTNPRSGSSSQAHSRPIVTFGTSQATSSVARRTTDRVSRCISAASPSASSVCETMFTTT